MNEVLPGHWIKCKLGDVISLKNGFAFKSKDYSADGIPVIRISDISRNNVKLDSAVKVPEEKANFDFLVEAGDLLIAMSGATTGKTGVYWGSDLALQNQRTGNFKIIDEQVLDKKYRNYYVASLRKDIENEAYGGAQPNISAKIIEQFDFPLAPLNEQKRIVAEIEKQFSRLDKAVTNLQRVKANLKRYKAAVLKAAVEGKLTEEWRKQNPYIEPASKLLKRILAERRTKWEEAELAKTKAKGRIHIDDKWKKKYKDPSGPELNGLPTIPDTWHWATVDQIADVQLGKMLDKKKHIEGRELSYLRNLNVRWGAIDSSNLRRMFFKDSELDRYAVHAGDVLVCEGGEPGRAAVWEGEIPGMMYQKALHRVRFFSGYPHKLLIYLLEYLAKSKLLDKAFTGSTINHFTRESFAKLPIPIVPIAEQSRIVEEVERNLSIIQEVEVQINQNLDRAERLRQSILQKAFSGELVHAKSTDEPASMLLERIRKTTTSTKRKKPQS